MSPGPFFETRMSKLKLVEILINSGCKSADVEKDLAILLPLVMSEHSCRSGLAEYAHSSWSGWMEYLFSKSEKKEDGTVVIPKDLVKRWERQVATKFKDLPDKEKESDFAEADKICCLLS